MNRSVVRREEERDIEGRGVVEEGAQERPFFGFERD